MGLMLLFPIQPARAATSSAGADRGPGKQDLQRYSVAIGPLVVDASGELRTTDRLELQMLRVCPDGTIVKPPTPCPKR